VPVRLSIISNPALLVLTPLSADMLRTAWEGHLLFCFSNSATPDIPPNFSFTSGVALKHFSTPGKIFLPNKPYMGVVLPVPQYDRPRRIPLIACIFTTPLRTPGDGLYGFFQKEILKRGPYFPSWAVSGPVSGRHEMSTMKSSLCVVQGAQRVAHGLSLTPNADGAQPQGYRNF